MRDQISYLYSQCKLSRLTRKAPLLNCFGIGRGASWPAPSLAPLVLATVLLVSPKFGVKMKRYLRDQDYLPWGNIFQSTPYQHLQRWSPTVWLLLIASLAASVGTPLSAG